MLPIVLGNFARQSRRRSSLLGEWLAPTLKFSEIAIATPSHDGTMIRMPKPYDGMFSSWRWQAGVEQVVDQPIYDPNSSSAFPFVSLVIPPLHFTSLTCKRHWFSFFSGVFSRTWLSREISKWVSTRGS